MGIATAQVLLDGAVIGTVTVGDDSEISPDPLGSGNAFGPAPSPDAFPQSYTHHPRNLLGETPSPGGHHSYGQPIHHRYLDPKNRATQTAREDTEGTKHPHGHRRFLDPENRKKQRAAEERGLEHYSTKDVAAALSGEGNKKGNIDRSKVAEELKSNPALLDRFARAVFHETSGDQRLQIEAESIANRALARKHSLAKALSGGSDHYHDTKVFNSPVTAEQMKKFKEEILPKVLAGSNLGEETLGFVPTGNASGSFAARRAARGGIYAKHKWLGDEMFALEQSDASRIGNLQRGTGKPIGVTELKAPTHGGEPTFAAVPGRSGLVDPISATGLGSGVGDPRGNHIHQGLDISAPHGSAIFASGSGTIMRHNPHGSFQGDAVTYIKLDNGMTIAYMHHALDPNLKEGSRVIAGQKIGTSGTANNVPHLHFETWEGDPHRSRLLDRGAGRT